MSSAIKGLLLTTLFASLTTAALCPSFTLTADAPGFEYDGYHLIQSGRSTYLASNAPTYPDAIPTFFLNDTTHLYATNMNVSYMEEFETGPFMLVTIEEGFLLFDNDPERNIFDAWSGTGWNFTTVGNETYVGYVPQGVGFASNNSSVGGWVVCAGTEVSLWTLGNTEPTDDPDCFPASFRVTDVNVTAAPFC